MSPGRNGVFPRWNYPSPSQNWLFLSPWEGLIFFANYFRRSIHVLPLSRLKLYYKNFYQVIFEVENRKVVFSQSDVGSNYERRQSESPNIKAINRQFNSSLPCNYRRWTLQPLFKRTKSL